MIHRTAWALLMIGCGEAATPVAAPAAPSAEEKELAHVERQLEELYGPLHFLVEESRLSIQDFLQYLGRDFIWPPGGTLPEGEFKAVIFKSEQDLMPRNDAMCRIIRDKGTLAEGGATPESFTAMVEHQESWRKIHDTWKKSGGPYDWFGKTSFPRNFGREVKASFAKLHARRGELASKVKGAELRWVRRQLDELYGPLGKLRADAAPADTLEHWQAIDKAGRLDRIGAFRDLLAAKLHLLDRPEIPAKFLALVDKHASYRQIKARNAAQGMPVAWHSTSPSPDGVWDEVEAAVKKLEIRAAELAPRD